MPVDAAATVLIGPPELAAALESDRPPLLLDVRWALGDPHGHQHYLEEHIAGARFVDLERELSGAPGPDVGRHPLPDVGELQSAARRWGLRQGQSVVVYDNSGSMAAARAWWVLRWAGVADVRILDGGLAAWTVSGRAVEAGPAGSGRTETDEPGDVTLSPGQLPVLDADAAARYAQDATLLDARAAERYRGEVEPIDPRAGHIPGALSAPTTGNLDEDGRFRSAAELRACFDALAHGRAETDTPAGTITGGGAVGVYCGSGVTAAHEIAALAIAGIPAALYAGSWSQWSNDPNRPVALGAQPG